MIKIYRHLSETGLSEFDRQYAKEILARSVKVHTNLDWGQFIDKFGDSLYYNALIPNISRTTTQQSHNILSSP